MKSSTNKPFCQNQQATSCESKIAGYKTALLVACGLLFVCLAAIAALWYQHAHPLPDIFIKTTRAGQYQLMVGRKPYLVRGVCYNPVPIGQNYDFDWWSDQYKPWLTDGALMKEMGVNTVRIYQIGRDPAAVKQVIRDLYDRFGIRTLLGHWLGFWEYPCPFYGDKDFQERVQEDVLKMVNLYKDEPGLLGWILGNENNYSCLGHINPWSTDEIDKEPDMQKRKAMRARIYYSFVNTLAQRIHAIDRNHPVGLGNGELITLDIAEKVCREVDFIACIIYRGKTFGNLFKSLKSTFDKPLLLSEIGADAYDAFRKKEDQNMQAFFLESQWRQIYANVAGAKDSPGNCLGGLIFEWSDEWWKHNPVDPESWKVHDTESNWSNGSYYFDIQAPNNMNMNEEWFGMVALSPDIKESGLDKRVPRKVFYILRELWKNPDRPQQTKERMGKNQ